MDEYRKLTDEIRMQELKLFELAPDEMKTAMIDNMKKKLNAVNEVVAITTILVRLKRKD